MLILLNHIFYPRIHDEILILFFDFIVNQKFVPQFKIARVCVINTTTTTHIFTSGTGNKKVYHRDSKQNTNSRVKTTANNLKAQEMSLAATFVTAVRMLAPDWSVRVAASDPQWLLV